MADPPSETGKDQDLPTRIGGKYTPIRIVGRGGMSVVYEVEHSFTRERLALKVLRGSAATLDPVGWARFRREARLSALIRNEHVVRVLDADVAPELGGAPYLVMDLLTGSDLGTLAGNAPQAPEKVVEWLRQAARAIDAAHRHGIIHRDIKPENLFLTTSRDGSPQVKVLDFGVASIPVVDDAQSTATGSFVGTPLFVAPEQASGADVGTRADIWSMGMCALRLLSGRPYWDAPNMTLLLAKIVYEDVKAPSAVGHDFGPQFDSWFLRSCARSPDDRWGTVGTQIEALAAALGCSVKEIPTTFPDETDVERSPAPERPGQSLGASVASASPDRPSRLGSWVAIAAFLIAAMAILFSPQARPARLEKPSAGEAPPALGKVTPEPAVQLPLPATLPSAADSAASSSMPTSTTSAAREPQKRVTRRPANHPPPESPAVPATVNTAPQVDPPAIAPAAPAGKPRDPLADPD